MGYQLNQNDNMDKIYVYDNPYSRQRIPHKDIKTTRRIKIKYNRVVAFEKFLQKKRTRIFNPLKRLLAHGLKLYKKHINYNWLHIIFSMKDMKDNTPSTDLQAFKLNSICVYDILPKEQISDFENGIKRFYYKHKKSGGLQHNDFRNFANMQTKNQTGLHLILNMLLNPKNSLSEYVDTICIFAEELDQAFYVITYSLILSDAATEKAREILSTQFSNDPLFSVTNKSLTSYKKYDFFGANKIELENFILGIKYNFFELIARYVPTFFFKRGVIPPHLTVVDSNGKPKNDLLRLFSFSVFKNEHEQEDGGDYDYKAGIFCNLGFMSNNKSFMHDHAIVFDSTSKPDCQYFAYQLEGYHVLLGKIFVSDVISEEVDRLIVKNQTKINKAIKKKILSTQSLLRTRLSIYQNIYLHQRIEKALVTSLRNNNDKYWGLDSFQNDYRKSFSKDFPYNNGILARKNALIRMLDRQIVNINNLFEVFDVKLKLFESSINVRLLRWTFILTIVGIVVSLFALLDSAEIINLAGFWRQIFK